MESTDANLELVLEDDSRTWKDKSGNILTTVLYDEKEFNLKDCILSWYLLSFNNISEDEPLKLCYSQKSTMPFDIVDDLLSTPIGGDKGIPMSRYDSEADWEETKYAHTYYDIFKFFGSTHKIIFVDNPVPWNPIEIWKCHKPTKIVDGIPICEESSLSNGNIDIGLRWHSINTMFFNEDEHSLEPTFTKCLMYGYGR